MEMKRQNLAINKQQPTRHDVAFDIKIIPNKVRKVREIN